MNQTQLSNENKIHLVFLSIGLVISAYGIYPIISIITEFPEDVNLFAASMALILLAMISSGCVIGIINIITTKLIKGDPQ